MTRGLRNCDRVEVSLLAPLPYSQSEATGFPIKPYGDNAMVVATESRRGASAEILAEAWRRQRFGYEYQALCHDGVYGLRFYSGRALRFETSVCFHCQNFYVPLIFSHGAFWWGFDGQSESAQALWRELNAIIPSGLRVPYEAELLEAKKTRDVAREKARVENETHTSGQKP